MAESSVQKARSGAMAAERIRQTALDQQAAALNDQSRQSYENMQSQQDEKAKSLGDYFGQQNGAPPAPAAGAPAEADPMAAGNVVIAAERAKQLGKAAAFSDQQPDALGELRSFGDILGAKSREQARNAGYIQQIGSFKQGSSSVLPLELEAANEKGGTAKLFGDLLGAGGSFLTKAGVSQNVAPVPGAGAAPVASSLPTMARSTPAAPLTLGRGYAGATNTFRLY